MTATHLRRCRRWIITSVAWVTPVERMALAQYSERDLT
jgi:hypothetical protein